MKLDDLRRHRRDQQQLGRPRFTQPAEVVAWLGAVQAQDYTGAKWALGQRLPAGPSNTDAALDEAFNSGAILRTHAMRPTWHFVAPADLRWLQMLTGPRVHKRNSPYYKKGGLDEATLKRAAAVLTKELRDLNYKNRNELSAALTAAGLERAGIDLALVVMWAELEGLLVSGPRVGKQFTYALLEERVTPAPALTRDEALATLVTRYFTSHGPAQAADFATWSSLTLGDTRRGLEMVGAALEQATLDGQTYWFAAADPPPLPTLVYLLPNYDEATLAYKDRSAFSLPGSELIATEQVTREYPLVFMHGGRVIGLWKRTLGKTVGVTPLYFAPPTPAQGRGFQAALQRYSAFLEAPVEVLPLAS